MYDNGQMFGVHLVQNSREEPTKNYQAWDAFMGRVWHNLLFFCDIKSNDVIIEVAPGSSTKIANALEKISFSGEIHLIEPHQQLSKKVKNEYQKRLPKATVHMHQCSLQQVYKILPTQPKALISNHSLDDMLLAETKYSNPALFQWALRQKDQSILPYQLIWEQITHDPQELNHCVNLVCQLWTNAIDHLQPHFCLLNQYPSYHMAQHQLDSLNREALMILKKLKTHYLPHCIPQSTIQTILNEMNNYNNPHIGQHILNAENWLVLSLISRPNYCNPVL